jgi:protein-S-isoprenylcysteine O-methyltransferase Ste14
LGFTFYGWGFILSTWGILTLRLSFSVLPEKRKIIQNGPYHFVNHPIYLGYALMTLGQSLASGYITLWIGTLLNSLLFIWRASKENKILYSN